ncbi:hypothetical protein [Kordiimonas marina]|uniref:hypothetical protein n=1 Tax=Kordiimonas marina TaxID=2872312 RepID=UPI001FF18214|nr:hypothetical protein [Kordiimonas marina]MCJ9428367.1 hypothetical protein [Kordiimonas marina]
MAHPVKLLAASLLLAGSATLVTLPVLAQDTAPGKQAQAETAKAKPGKAAKAKHHVKHKKLNPLRTRQRQEWKDMVAAQKKALENPSLSADAKATLRKQQVEERKAMVKRHKEERAAYRAERKKKAEEKAKQKAEKAAKKAK